MGRKKKANPNKKIISFVITFLMMATGVYYYGLNYVPQKWYETQTMLPNQVESYYVNQWCTPDFGRKEIEQCVLDFYKRRRRFGGLDKEDES